MRISVYFEPRDVWVGVFWKATPGCRYLNPRWQAMSNGGFRGGEPRTGLTEAVTRWEAWVCLLPMLPIRLEWFRPRASEGRAREVAKR